MGLDGHRVETAVNDDFRPGDESTGIVHQNIDSTAGRSHPVNQRHELRPLGNIAAFEGHLVPVVAETVEHCVGLVDVASDNHDVCSSGRQRASDMSA